MHSKIIFYVVFFCRVKCLFIPEAANGPSAVQKPEQIQINSVSTNPAQQSAKKPQQQNLTPKQPLPDLEHDQIANPNSIENSQLAHNISENAELKHSDQVFHNNTPKANNSTNKPSIFKQSVEKIANVDLSRVMSVLSNVTSFVSANYDRFEKIAKEIDGDFTAINKSIKKLEMEGLTIPLLCGTILFCGTLLFSIYQQRSIESSLKNFPGKGKRLGTAENIEMDEPVTSSTSVSIDDNSNNVSGNGSNANSSNGGDGSNGTDGDLNGGNGNLTDNIINQSANVSESLVNTPLTSPENKESVASSKFVKV